MYVSNNAKGQIIDETSTGAQEKQQTSAAQPSNQTLNSTQKQQPQQIHLEKQEISISDYSKQLNDINQKLDQNKIELILKIDDGFKKITDRIDDLSDKLIQFVHQFQQQQQQIQQQQQYQYQQSASAQKQVQVDSKEVKNEVFTSSNPVDEFVLDKDSYLVYESGGKIYDCVMSQTNIIGENNNNKFYIVQLLKSKIADNYVVFNRWGRVGVPGQKALFPFGGNVAAAIQAYDKKIQEKSVKGDYRVLEKDYCVESDHKAQKELEKSKVNNEKEAFDKGKLHQKVKELIQLIFDMKMMNQQMKEFCYDAKKMPLGKLAASTIKQGFDVLKEISDELENKKPNLTTLQTLTCEFYSHIPHDFGFQKYPLINTKELVKNKLDMLEAIQHIQVAARILKENQEDENLIDQNYKKLNIDMQYLDHNNEKVKLIKQYIENTQEDYDLEVLDMFELTKDEDEKRFIKDLDNRLLLWHGTRLTNFVDILGQGLRIPPPEAPTTGYRFGKGVYLADMIGKSAGYCYPSYETKTGLILLCDSALGNQNIKLSDDYNASTLPPGKHSTWAKAKSYPPASSLVDMPGMPGVKVPIGKPVPSDVANKSILQHNEFIVYDVAQVRLKYLIKLKWNGKIR